MDEHLAILSRVPVQRKPSGARSLRCVIDRLAMVLALARDTGGSSLAGNYSRPFALRGKCAPRLNAQRRGGLRTTPPCCPAHPVVGGTGGSGLRCSPRILDLDYLAPAVHAAVWADVVRSLERPTTCAGHELGGSQVDMAATGPLMGLADALLGKCSHGDHLVIGLGPEASAPLARKCRYLRLDMSASSSSRLANSANRASPDCSDSVERSNGPGQSGPQLGCIGIDSTIHCRSASARSIS